MNAFDAITQSGTISEEHPGNTLYDRGVLLGACVAILAFLVSANSIWNGFVWDDNFIIVSNPVLKGEIKSLFRGVDSFRELGSTPYYRPLSLLTFLLDYRFNGLNPFIMHLCEVLLHSTNALLVYLLAGSVLNNRYAAVITGILFAVHPISAESVNFLSARNVLLSTTCMLSAYLLHGLSIRKNSYFLSGAAALLFLAGLFTKETVLMMVPFIAALEASALKRMTSPAGGRALLRLVPYGVALSFYLFMRNSALVNAGVQMEIVSGLGSRLLNNIYIIPHYLFTLIWPPALSNRYFVPDDLHLFILPLTVAWLCILIVFGWLIVRSRSRATVFGLLWVFSFWLPTSGVVFFPSAPMADRFFYVPVIGIWIVLADQLCHALRKSEKVRAYGVLVTLVTLILAASTVARNRDWKSDISLFSRYVKQYPDVAGGHYNLGSAYMEKEQDLDMAERSFAKAFALDPTFPKLRTNMGFARLQRGDLTGALTHYTAAIKLNPNDTEALLNSGVVLEKLFRFQEAIESYRRFLATPGTDFAETRATLHMKINMLEQLAQIAGTRSTLSRGGQ